MVKSEIIKTMEAVALKASEIQLNYFLKFDKLKPEEKSYQDYVTIADKESEEMIIQGLQKAFPDYGFIGEESGIIKPEAKKKGRGFRGGRGQTTELAHKLVDPHDTTKPLEDRARSYFYTNCASCHQEAGGGNSLMNMDFTVPLDRMRMVGVKPLHNFPDNPNAELIKPGEPDNSVVFLRMSRRGTGQMPPLSTNVVDQKSVEMLRDWITSLKGREMDKAKTEWGFASFLTKTNEDGQVIDPPVFIN